MCCESTGIAFSFEKNLASFPRLQLEQLDDERQNGSSNDMYVVSPYAALFILRVIAATGANLFGVLTMHSAEDRYFWAQINGT